MSSKKSSKKKAERASSNIFSMFDQKQITEFKEAFQIIDNNRDGLIDNEDLRLMLESLGKTPTEKEIDDMLAEATGAMNFTMFLTLLGRRMAGRDTEETILNAFSAYDLAETGWVVEEDLKNDLIYQGPDPFTEEEATDALSDPPRAIIDDEKKLDYRILTKMILGTYTEEDEEKAKEEARAREDQELQQEEQ